MSISLVGIGDLHLTDDKGHGGLAKYIEAPDIYVMSEAQRVVNWARKKGISLVVFYGDICENPRMSYEANLALAKFFRRNKDMEFIVYRGNHDSLAEGSEEGHSLELLMSHRLKNVQVFVDDAYVTIGKQQIKICPWPSTAFDPKCLNFGHTEVFGSKLDSGRKMESEELPKSKAVICMGHLHTNHKVRNTYYSGTLYQTNFGESLPKFFHHVQFTSADDFEIESVPFDPKYHLYTCVVETQDDVDALSRNPNHLIKLVVKDGADVNVPNLPNIVITKAFSTKSDLASILTEDLISGKELVIKSADFFHEWIAQQSIPERLKSRTRKLRLDILSR